MAYFLGIDLGSTTTKAVLMDRNERIVGRGITNTRSNYHTATAVASEETFTNARFSILKDEMQKERDKGEAEKMVFLMEQNFRLLQHLHRIRRLREIAFMYARETTWFGEKERAALESIFEGIENDTAEMTRQCMEDRSRFFRDMAGSRYLLLAEKEAKGRMVSFERLMGVFDKSIIRVENETLDMPFAEGVGKALEMTAREIGDGALQAMAKAAERVAGTPLEPEFTVGTGYGRQRLPFKKEQIRSEILCHGLGAHYFFPDTRTVLDIGGQDTKAIQVDESGIVTSFQMNDRCAAGCGRYLGYVADELGIGLQDIGPLALTATRIARVNSTCTVFAGTEIRERRGLGENREDILSGLHRAIVLRAMALLARAGGIRHEFTFTGGVAKNPAVVKYLRQLASEHYGERKINIHPDSIYMGAVGAALFARRH